MSNLEKYILDNRDELDRMESVPEAAMWQKIRANSIRQKPPARTGVNWKWLAIAALVLSVAGWGLLFCKKQAMVPTTLPPQQLAVPQVTVPIAEQKEAPKVIQPQVNQGGIAQAQITTPPSQRPAKRRPAEKAQPIVAPAPEVSEEAWQLQQLVAQKQREIGLDTLNREDYADLLRELDELEISVAEARQDLGSMPQRERLMETLIRYYELKIRILEQINYEINKQKYHEALEKRI